MNKYEKLRKFILQEIERVEVMLQASVKDKDEDKCFDWKTFDQYKGRIEQLGNIVRFMETNKDD